MLQANPLVVIVAYRNTPGLETCLQSLEAGQSVLVVDNDADVRVRSLVERYGGLYVTPGRNIGFAAAVNIALRERGRRDVLLLNPDAQVSADLPRELRAVLEADPRVGAVAPRLRDDEGDLQRVEWPIPSPREEWVDALRLRRVCRPRRTFYIGAVLLLRAEALADVGLFDERFFLYAEECDWQLRALRRGWRIELAEDVYARHSGAGSSDMESVRQRYFKESAELFGRKWYGRSGWASMRIASLTGAALRLVASLHRPSQRARYARELRS